MWSPICDLFNPLKRKVIMRSTAFAVFTTVNGCVFYSKSVSNVYKVINPEALIGEIVRDWIYKLYQQGDYICRFKLITEKEFLERKAGV